ncbi:glycoside hydrolase family 140 protein [Arcticibacterium luteifluviistationis]|uniref:Endoglucanase n=1 Tax=Arcticibacterium luteifluviistationis TaxID=1784714 RepID=A0A2Z4GE53_9BACT|nr:glycoside hydrolase family 140 protein [Arcticibacterium luteifluviistationis]AWV99421.1 endoglucanase [Arcticibacterium luteifluviistationis]
MKKLLSLTFILLLSFGSYSQKLKISKNGKYLSTEKGKPFFWMGDTAWELIHRLDREEVDHYLSTRAAQGFNVIQTVILAELDGLNTPNAYGQKPLLNNDPKLLNEAYFEHVDYVIKKAKKLGLQVALLPTWGDKFNIKWGEGPVVFNPENAEVFGQLLAKRYLKYDNIIWVLGGDRIPEEEVHFDIVRAMAKGIRSVDSKHLMSYHPSGTKIASEYFDDEWLDIDMFQSGHSRLSKEYEYAGKVKDNRPIINGEARYENIGDRFWEKTQRDWLNDADARISGYWSILSGTAGYTYGCNDVWQMYAIDREPQLKARTGWDAALQLPGANQMKYLKALFESLPWQQMSNDQSLISTPNPEDESHILASIAQNKDVILAYTPTGKAFQLDLSKVKAKEVNTFWYNPRSGKSKSAGIYKTTENPVFEPWSNGWGSDFILVVMDVNSEYKLPEF